MKKIFAFIMACCMALCVSGIAYAAEPENKTDYMNYDFPEDAIVLYQGEDGVVYQSKTSARSMTYESKWIDAGKNELGTFSITNPHPNIFTRTNGTLKVESTYKDACVDIKLYAGGKLLFSKYVYQTDGEVHAEFNSISKDITIQYSTVKVSSQGGIRVMCWLW
mgnify:FL=1